jgi:hypothetical protein
MIEVVANERVRVEDVDLRSLCLRYNLGTKNDCFRVVKEESVQKASHGGGLDTVTWTEIESADKSLATKVWNTARSYGYNRDPPLSSAT